MAEYLLKVRLPHDSEWEVVSAGTSASDGFPASHYAVEVMRERGVDISGHQSTQLTIALIESAQLIVPMTASHRDTIVNAVPASADKVRLMSSFDTSKAEKDVDDPMGQSRECYSRVRDEIEEGVSKMVMFLETNN
jgi:protein-tyrosine-phosphatase